MTNNHITTIAQKLFGYARPYLDWGKIEQCHQRDWYEVVCAILAACEEDTPREDVAKRAYSKHWKLYPYHSGWDHGWTAKNWEDWTTFVITEYLLTPRNK